MGEGWDCPAAGATDPFSVALGQDRGKEMGWEGLLLLLVQFF